MGIGFHILRSLSTRVPRPKNWRTSPFDSPRPVTPSSQATIPTKVAHPHRRPRASPPTGNSTPSRYIKHRQTLKKDFPEGWSPPRKLSRDAMDGLRMLNAHSPETFTTPVLAERFKISPEAVRRILKSRWVPDKERRMELRLRDEARKAERRRGRARKEWAEGIEKGVLAVKTERDEDRLELT